MSDLINIKDERFWDILFHEACVEGEQARRIEKKLEQITVEPMRGEWIDVKDALPPEKEHWKEYIVCVERSHYPTSTYDIIDSPYSETIITTAKYDSQQKIWHLQWDEQLNALMDIDDSPLNGDYITHWMPLPKL